MNPKCIDAHLRLGEVLLYLARVPTLALRIGLDFVIGGAIQDLNQRNEIVVKCNEKETRRLKTLYRLAGHHLAIVYKEVPHIIELMVGRLRVFPDELNMRKRLKRMSYVDLEKFASMLNLYWAMKKFEHKEEGDMLCGFIHQQVQRLLAALCKKYDERKAMMREKLADINDSSRAARKAEMNWSLSPYPIRGVLNMSNNIEVACFSSSH